jgi:hypothetical protein
VSSQLCDVILVIIVQEIRRHNEVIVELLESQKYHLCDHVKLQLDDEPSSRTELFCCRQQGSKEYCHGIMSICKAF